MSRTESRILLMQMVFQMEAQNDKSIRVMSSLMKDKKISDNERKYILDTFKTLCDNLEEIDRQIDEHSPKWKVKRMPKADLAILRLGICEAKYCDNIPKAVAVNEAVNLAKEYGADNGAAFINGVIGKIIND